MDFDEAEQPFEQPFEHAVGGVGDEYSFFGPTGTDMWAASDVGFYGPDTSSWWDGSQGFTYLDPAPGMADVWHQAGFTDADVYGLPDNPYFFDAAQEVYAVQSGNIWTGDGYIQTDLGVYDQANAAWDEYLQG